MGLCFCCVSHRFSVILDFIWPLIAHWAKTHPYVPELLSLRAASSIPTTVPQEVWTHCVSFKSLGTYCRVNNARFGQKEMHSSLNQCFSQAILHLWTWSGEYSAKDVSNSFNQRLDVSQIAHIHNQGSCHFYELLYLSLKLWFQVF